MRSLLNDLWCEWDETLKLPNSQISKFSKCTQTNGHRNHQYQVAVHSNDATKSQYEWREHSIASKHKRTMLFGSCRLCMLIFALTLYLSHSVFGDQNMQYANEEEVQSICLICSTLSYELPKWIQWAVIMCVYVCGRRTRCASEAIEWKCRAALRWSLHIDYRLHRYPPNQFERCSHANTTSSSIYTSHNSIWNLFFASFWFLIRYATFFQLNYF